MQCFQTVPRILFQISCGVNLQIIVKLLSCASSDWQRTIYQHPIDRPSSAIVGVLTGIAALWCPHTIYQRAYMQVHGTYEVYIRQLAQTLHCDLRFKLQAKG